MKWMEEQIIKKEKKQLNMKQWFVIGLVTLSVVAVFLCYFNYNFGYDKGYQEGAKEGVIYGGNMVAGQMCNSNLTFQCGANSTRYCGCFNVINNSLTK